jgi:nitrogen-specific signal transduction histidine kinase
VTIRDPDFACWVVGSMRSGLVAIDANGAVVAMSPDAQRILGCPEGPLETLLGRPCQEVLAAQPVVLARLCEALDGRDRPSRAELVLEPVDGRPARTIGFTLLCVRDPSGVVQGAAIVFRDLTPYERMDEQDRLRDRLAVLGQMAAGLAHAIRNPLASMEVLAGLLKRQLGDRPEERSLVEELLGELRALAGMVTASLEFVRPVSISRAPCNPEAILEASLDLARARVAFSGEIVREYADPLPCLSADADELKAVLTDLLVNALESMAEGGSTQGHRLVLQLRAEGAGDERRELEIRISDSGPGIPQELRERIFHPFFTTKEHGSGVGLANAQKVILSHGGSIEVESGGGSTFQVRLPLDEAPG